MTATTVNGLPVMADTDTVSGLIDRAGNRVIWTQTRTLLLGDGSTVYGCQHCDYTSPNINSVRPHLNAHRKPPSSVDVKALTLDEIGQRLAQVERLTAERDGWRKRALAAEKSLRTLKNALRGVS